MRDNLLKVLDQPGYWDMNQHLHYPLNRAPKWLKRATRAGWEAAVACNNPKMRKKIMRPRGAEEAEDEAHEAGCSAMPLANQPLLHATQTSTAYLRVFGCAPWLPQ